jgi:hypothetical protein
LARRASKNPTITAIMYGMSLANVQLKPKFRKNNSIAFIEKR